MYSLHSKIASDSTCVMANPMNVIFTFKTNIIEKKYKTITGRVNMNITQSKCHKHSSIERIARKVDVLTKNFKCYGHIVSNMCIV